MKSMNPTWFPRGEDFLLLEPITRKSLQRNFSIGDVLSARIKKKLDAHRFILHIKGMDLVGSSKIDFDEGQRIRAQVQEFSSQIQLKLLSDPHDPGITKKQINEMLSSLNLKPDPVYEEVIRSRVKYQLPVDPDEIVKHTQLLQKHLSFTSTPEAQFQPDQAEAIKEWSERLSFLESLSLKPTEENISMAENVIPPPHNLPEFLDKLNEWVKSIPLDKNDRRADRVTASGEIPSGKEDLPLSDAIKTFVKLLDSFTYNTESINNNTEETPAEHLKLLFTPPETIIKDIENILTRISNIITDNHPEDITLMNVDGKNLDNIFIDLIDKLISDDSPEPPKKLLESFMDTIKDKSRDSGEVIQSIRREISNLPDLITRFKRHPANLNNRMEKDYPEFLSELSGKLFNDTEKLARTLSFHIKHQPVLNHSNSKYYMPDYLYMEVPAGPPGKMFPFGISIYRKTGSDKKKYHKDKKTQVTLLLSLSHLKNIRVDIQYQKSRTTSISFRVENTGVESFIKKGLHSLGERLKELELPSDISISLKKNIGSQTLKDLKNEVVSHTQGIPGQVDILV